MEYKKKKNDEADRPTFIRIATVLVLILIFGIVVLINTIIQSREDYSFNMTATTIVSTNDNLRHLIPTDYVVTEQFIMTSTAQP